MMNMVRTAQNPQAMMNQLIQGNPNMQQAMDLIRASGNDPKRAFYALAEQKGINPQEVLDALK